MNPYLHFPNCDCKAAFEHYQQVFGAKCVFSTTWAEAPPPRTRASTNKMVGTERNMARCL